MNVEVIKMKIECHHKLCIYQCDEKCLLDEISINNAGACEDCIYIDVEEDELEAKKKELRRKLAERWHYKAL